MASVASSRTLSIRANGTTTWDEMSARFNVFNELIPMDSAVRQLVDDSRDTFKPCWHLLSKEAQNAVVDQVQAASDEVKSKLKVWSQGVRTDTVRKAFRRVSTNAVPQEIIDTIVRLLPFYSITKTEVDCDRSSRLGFETANAFSIDQDCSRTSSRHRPLVALQVTQRPPTTCL